MPACSLRCSDGGAEVGGSWRTFETMQQSGSCKGRTKLSIFVSWRTASQGKACDLRGKSRNTSDGKAA